MSPVKLGAAIFIFGRCSPDGSLSATRASLEKDGVKLPM